MIKNWIRFREKYIYFFLVLIYIMTNIAGFFGISADKAKIRLDKKYHSCSVADSFSVECDANPLDMPYIRSISLNGQKLDRPYLTYGEITAGGVLKFELSKEPCEDFGKDVPKNFFD